MAESGSRTSTPTAGDVPCLRSGVADDILLFWLPDLAWGPLDYNFQKLIPCKMEKICSSQLGNTIANKPFSSIFNSYVTLPNGLRYEIAVKWTDTLW